ncbi:MAG: hypothetical protein ACI379_03385 [Nocardioides sp.]|uniref:hypothetical protein n=1 Tax=Nocardioides sp. TaxID=35761 RepID=UPI003EFD4828
MTRRRPPSIAVVAALALSTSLLAAPAQAAVTDKQLPTQKQVVAVYPHLKGGPFEIVREKTFVAPDPGCTGDTPVPVRSARNAYYDRKGGAIPTGAKPSVMIRVAEFKTVKKAKAMMKRHRDFIGHCTYMGDTYGSTDTTPFRAPKVGADRVGYRSAITPHDGEPFWWVNVVVRKGRTIVDVAAHGDTSPVRAKPFRKLVRVAAKKA